MKSLVTGGAGFTGPRCIRHRAAHHPTATAVDLDVLKRPCNRETLAEICPGGIVMCGDRLSAAVQRGRAS